MGVVREPGNPFLETGHELVAIDTHDVMEPEVAMSLSKIFEVHKALHETYVENRVRKAAHPILPCLGHVTCVSKWR
jgi:hypothetical protein